MAKPITISDILGLSIAERIQFIEDVWDTIAALPEAVPLSQIQKKELDKRLTAYHRNPQAGTPWNIIKQRLLKSK